MSDLAHVASPMILGRSYAAGGILEAFTGRDLDERSQPCTFHGLPATTAAKHASRRLEAASLDVESVFCPRPIDCARAHAEIFERDDAEVIA